MGAVAHEVDVDSTVDRHAEGCRRGRIGPALLPTSHDRIDRGVLKQLGKRHRGGHSPAGAAVVLRIDETRQTAGNTISGVDRDAGERDRHGIVGVGNIATP